MRQFEQCYRHNPNHFTAVNPFDDIITFLRSFILSKIPNILALYLKKNTQGKCPLLNLAVTFLNVPDRILSEKNAVVYVPFRK